MIDFDTFTKIVGKLNIAAGFEKLFKVQYIEFKRIGQINCCQRLKELSKGLKSCPKAKKSPNLVTLLRAVVGVIWTTFKT